MLLFSYFHLVKQLFVALFLTLVVYGHSQQLHFFKPDNLSRLPSSESYNVMQDSKGYIWFSTEAGLCRYNGSEIKVFDATNGLPEEACYAVAEDNNGKLWFLTSQRRILNCINDTLVEPAWCKKFTRELDNNLVQLYSIKVESDSQIWVTAQYKTFLLNPLAQTFRQVKISERNTVSDFYMNGKCLVPVKNVVSAGHKETGQRYHFTVNYFGKNIRLSVPYKKRQAPSWRFLTALNSKGEGFIGVDTFLIRVTPGLKCQVYPVAHTILQLYCDKDDGLYLCTSKGGLEYYPRSEIRPNNRITALSDLTVTGVCEDYEGGLWCTTLEKGIFYCRNKMVLVYSNVPGLDKHAGLLRVQQNKLYVSSSDAELFEIAQNTIVKHRIKHPPGSALADIISQDGGWYLLSRAYCTFNNADFTRQQAVDIAGGDASIGGSQLVKGPDGRLFFTSYGAVGEISKLDQQYTVIIKHSPTRTIHYARNGKFLMGLKAGLYELNRADTSIGQIEGVGENVTRLGEDAGGSVWAATKGNGVYILSPDGTVHNLCDSLDLGTMRFFDVSADRYGNMWLASNLGMTKVSKQAGRYIAKTFNTFNGLPSNEIFRLAADSAYLYMSTYEGLCRFPLDADLSNAAPPALRMNSILVNGVTLPDSERELQLSHDQNTLKITFDVLTFKQAGQEPLVAYYVAGLDTSIHFVREKFVGLSNLAPGMYRLYAYAINNDGVLNIAPLMLAVTVAAPWWRHPLALVLGAAALLAILFLSVKKVIDRVRRKEREKARIGKMLTEFHMSALRAQMNPHFIFNCINSIQRFVITNRAEEAYNYLAKFSKLIRLVLTYAEENFITLAQELEVTTLYLELEQLRVEDRFSYTISCPADAGEAEVPVMMLQPYVENAIWHGIMNLPAEKKGKITINIVWIGQGDLLEVIVEDNGVGREAAAQLSKKSHISKSTDINRKRMEMMKLMTHGDAGRITIDDILDENNSVTGTRVTMRIPQQEEIHEYD